MHMHTICCCWWWWTIEIKSLDLSLCTLQCWQTVSTKELVQWSRGLVKKTVSSKTVMCHVTTTGFAALPARHQPHLTPTQGLLSLYMVGSARAQWKIEGDIFLKFIYCLLTSALHFALNVFWWQLVEVGGRKLQEGGNEPNFDSKFFFLGGDRSHCPHSLRQPSHHHSLSLSHMACHSSSSSPCHYVTHSMFHSETNVCVCVCVCEQIAQVVMW